MDKTTHQVRFAQWTQIIEACNQRPSGMTAKQWLADNNISEKSYYYWQRKIRKALTDTSPVPVCNNEITFAEITNFCQECGSPLVSVGKEFVRTEIAYMEKSPMPYPVIQHSYASPSTVVWVIRQKYELAVLLYRQENE